MADELEPIKPILQEIVAKCATHQSQNGYPFVTLTYAQTLDGSIATADGKPMKISNELSLRLTHELRAIHDLILVGVGTVISDNPSLTVRYADGDNPQPVIIDSNLRCPLDCKLLQAPECRRPIILTSFTGLPVDGQGGQVDTEKAKRKAKLEELGARVVCCESVYDEHDKKEKISIGDALRSLNDYSSVMIEGGASIIRSCLSSNVLEHISQVILTISPMWVGGLRPTPPCLGHDHLPRLQNLKLANLGGDIIIQGVPF